MSIATALRDRDVAQLPSRRDEDWRWTDLRGLIRVLPAPSAAADTPAEAGPFDGLADEIVTVVNGRGSKPIAVAPHRTATVALRILAQGDGGHATALEVNVGADGRLVLLESYEGEGAYLAETSIRFVLAPGAQVERLVLARDDANAVSVSLATVDLAPRSRFQQTVMTSGARRQRLETIVSHPGAQAEVRLDGVYLLSDKRHSDLTTIVIHSGVDGVTGQLTKGVARDQSRAVFQGRIVVAEGADRTDARMGHHALILSDRAEVDAKPELEIFADDVACAHGNTVGALDDDALFYAQQRGMPEAVARALLMEAFIGEVTDRIEHAEARAVCRAWVIDGLRVGS